MGCRLNRCLLLRIVLGCLMTSPIPFRTYSGTGFAHRRQSDPLSRTSLERGPGPASGLIPYSLFHATWVSYTKVWLEWEALLNRVDVCVQFEDWVTVVLYFLGHLHEGGVSVSGIYRQMAALVFWFNLKGVGNPLGISWSGQPLGCTGAGRRGILIVLCPFVCWEICSGGFRENAPRVTSDCCFMQHSLWPFLERLVFRSW